MAACVFATSASAQGLDIVGNVSWDKSGSGIRIFAERIDNNDASGSSGFLRLQVWATEAPYDGNDLTGYVLGTFNVGYLDAGFSFVDLARRVRYFKPPPGIYFTTITLEEEDVNGDFFIVDYQNFEDPINLEGYGFGGVQDLESAEDITFIGDVSWLAGNKKVEIVAERIQNERSGGRSGILRIRLWATSTPYQDGDVLQGYPMATKRIGRLNSLEYIPDFYGKTTFNRPPRDGLYYVTMTLEEYVHGLWEIVDHITFPDQSLF